MIVDRKQVNWAWTTGVAIVVLAITYGIYSTLSVIGPRGGSVLGIIFGSTGFAVFLFECLLSLRKKLVKYRAGPLQAWLRAHLWLGILSFLLVLMHSGFRWGNGLAATLMWLLLIVVASGVAGVALQHYLPRRMEELVEREIIFEDIPRVMEKLRREAGERFRLLTAVDIGADVKSKLDAIARYLEGQASLKFFPTRKSIREYFGELRASMPFATQHNLKALEAMCEERRQLVVQRRLHHLLHGWLLMHVPLSFGLIALTAVHAVLALRY
jgi:hypothetical protein